MRLEKVMDQFGVDVEKWNAVAADPNRQADPEFLSSSKIRVLPYPWACLQQGVDGGAYSNGTLTVIASVAKEVDGLHWLHVSVTRRDRKMPTYEDLCTLKTIFIGSDRKAIQVFPASREHVNLHPTCLHLFACLDGDPLPDFTGGTGSI